MHAFSIIFGAAVLLAQATSVLAGYGTASVYNDCGVPVYYKIVVTSDPGFAAIPSGGVHTTYSSPGEGVSIKLALNNSASAPVSQFELTLYDNNIAYDLSNINGYPFYQGGVTIEPSVSSSSSFPTCVPVNCAAGVEDCTAAYNEPNDTDTLVCEDTTSLTLTLCSGKPLVKRVTHVHKPRHLRHPHARPQ